MASKRTKPQPSILATTIEDLVVASRILAMQEVLDAFGHVSIRHPDNPKRFLMSRSLAPELVTADDIVELDLDSNLIAPKDRKLFVERFIHGEIYKSRPDVNAVVHSHSPSIVPFGITRTALKPVYHMSGFLHAGVPNFDIRKTAGDTDMLVRDGYLGAALAKTLGGKPLALMRGHGNVVVGADVRIAVYRAIYTEINARLQWQAKLLGGKPNYLTNAEGKKAEAANAAVVDRPWHLWRTKALATL
jgi:ribulose-5-phosphate 4-epimerase/fuculose-1-phosphate aldolase